MMKQFSLSVVFLLSKRMEQYIKKELNIKEQKPIKVKECYHDLESWLDLIEGIPIDDLPSKFTNYDWRCEKCYTIFQSSEHLNDHNQYYHVNVIKK